MQFLAGYLFGILTALIWLVAEALYGAHKIKLRKHEAFGED